MGAAKQRTMNNSTSMYVSAILCIIIAIGMAFANVGIAFFIALQGVTLFAIGDVIKAVENKKNG